MRFSGPYIVDSKIDRYIELVAGLDLDNRRHSYYRESIQGVLDIFSLPVPSHDFMDYASKNILELILSGVLRELIDSRQVDNARLEMISKAYKKIGTKPYNASSATYRLRTFGQGGIYPNSDFYRAGARYMVINGQPFLLTKNVNTTEERYQGGGAENTVLSRREVKLLASLMCVNGLIVKFSLIDDYNRSNILEVQADLLREIPEEKIANFLIEYLRILGSSRLTGHNEYEYTPSSWASAEIAQYYRSFRIDDLLLLRTSYLLIKASSMVLNINYFEDAVSNIFVGIEGVLMMMQRNDGKKYESIDRGYHKTKFASLFNDNDQLYDFLFDEVFARGEKRAILVHPQAGTDWGWIPFIVGEDYHDYRQILRSLLTYVVTGTAYDPYEYR